MIFSERIPVHWWLLFSPLLTVSRINIAAPPVFHYSSDMAALLDRITINPQQCGGRPCVRGMRIRVTDVLDLLAAGRSA